MSLSISQKFHLVMSAREVMATEFWDSEGNSTDWHLEHSSTITGSHYPDLTGQCRTALKKKRWGKLNSGVLFHQDNAPSHILPRAWSAIWNADFELLHRQLYLPILAPVTYISILFPKLKESWKDRNLLTTRMLFTLQVACWRSKIKQSSTMESGLSKNAGPSAFLLERL